MSEISDSARVSIVLTDFANVDASGKLNLIGAGVAITAIDPQTGQTAPLTVVVICSVPSKFVGQHFAVELALYAADDGQLVLTPGPVPSPLRIGQPVAIQPPQPPPGSYIPPGTVWPATQMVVAFQAGLPLASGRAYEWRASIDGNVVCVANLLVAGAPPVTFG